MNVSDDEFEFTDFTEEELSQIDSVADAAFASQSIVWPVAPTDTRPEADIRADEPELPATDPRSRKSSGLTIIDLTEEELRLLDQSVAHLESSIHLPPEINPPAATASTRPSTQHIEVSLESPLLLPSSPAPTLGRSSRSPSPTSMSLYSLFRSSRNSLSVSDIVGPAWCELQYDYGLRGRRHLPVSKRPTQVVSRTGKIIPVQKSVAAKNDVVKKGGTSVHKKLEREIRPTEIAVTTITQEDRWGLKLLDMISNVRVLIDEGRCREMPVMGFINDHFVTGIIDEIVRTPAPPVSPTVPGHFLTSNQPPAPVKGLSHDIHILDNKTRGVASIPKSRDSYQSRLQLMLYKLLLDMLLEPPTSSSSSLSSHFSFSDIWMHQSVDASEPFSDLFLEESALLVAANELGATAARAKCLNDLIHAWEEITGELLGEGRIKNEDGVVSKTLKLVYRLRETAKNRSKRLFALSGPSSGAASSNDIQIVGSSNRSPKKPRADSEDLDLQRAIHASLVPHSIVDTGTQLQEHDADAMQRDENDEEGIDKISAELSQTPGGWISPEELPHSIQESLEPHENESSKLKYVAHIIVS
ncbi:defects in morphology protein 1, precursor [Ceratobasidium sp. AG-Ba]|nr:defects in morphology protein 1, precursor [Ceratobasidium sp. AG-Ba]